MLDKDVEELNQQMANEDEHILIPIRRLYIQEFAEANYGRGLTETELEKLTWMAWETSWKLDEWLDEAIREIMKGSDSKNNHEATNK